MDWFLKTHLTSQDKVLIRFQLLEKILIVERRIVFNFNVSL